MLIPVAVMTYMGDIHMGGDAASKKPKVGQLQTFYIKFRNSFNISALVNVKEFREKMRWNFKGESYNY
jgi:hypothetical protein